MQALVDQVVGAATEILVILVLSLLSVAGVKVKSWLEKAKAKDTLGIIDIITDRAVEYANAELKGAKGKEKRDFALSHARSILAQYGIKVTDEQLLADIENGYNKWANQSGWQLTEAPEVDLGDISGVSVSIEK
jgi:hypothetical protein